MEDFLQLLRDWLCDESEEKWLMVLDNADNVGFLLVPTPMSSSAQPAQRQINYIPMCDYGSVIIATRSERDALRLVHESDTVRSVANERRRSQGASQKQAGTGELEQLRTGVGIKLHAVGHAQAAAYARARTPRCSVQ